MFWKLTSLDSFSKFQFEPHSKIFYQNLWYISVFEINYFSIVKNQSTEDTAIDSGLTSYFIPGEFEICFCDDTD